MLLIDLLGTRQGSPKLIHLMEALIRTWQIRRFSVDFMQARLPGGPFWNFFKDSKGRLSDPALWERIVRKGGDEGTPESLRKRIRMLKKAGVHDPRDGTNR